MLVPKALSELFQEDYARFLYEFVIHNQWLGKDEIPTGQLNHDRYLSRSISPHVLTLSNTFNRREPGEVSHQGNPPKRPPVERPPKGDGRENYWNEGSHPDHLRLAYFLYFMPANCFRVAAVWAELHRLGYRWKTPEGLRAVEFGAGPATASCGVLAGEATAPLGLPLKGDWALIEQDRKMARLGASYLPAFKDFLCSVTQKPDLASLPSETRVFVRKLKLSQGFLPPNAPQFHLWLMSYALNEFQESPQEIAQALFNSWEKHLADDGLVILVEPALKAQSRRLLEIRKTLLELFSSDNKNSNYKILLPCLGDQACGALAEPTDWCHEEVAWWRAEYSKKIDALCGLDRKTLPFSYLVIAKSKLSVCELLPALAGDGRSEIKAHRLVSPAHSEGPDSEFYICGSDGKRRARLHEKHGKVARGSLLIGAELRGATAATRIDRVEKLIPDFSQE